MDIEELKKYAERAGEVLANYALKTKKQLKPAEKAAKEFLESQKDLEKIEVKFNANSIDIIYKYLKRKYKDIEFPEKLDKMVQALKFYSQKQDEQSVKNSQLLYKQIVEEIKKLEKEILKIDSNYIPKFL